MLRLPGRIGEADPARRLLLLWQEALANPLHTPGCGCMGGVGLTLHADLLEEDILDFLEARHRADDAVLGLLRERRDARPTDFPHWLELAVSRLPEAAGRQVRADVTGVLESMTGQARGGF